MTLCVSLCTPIPVVAFRACSLCVVMLQIVWYVSGLFIPDMCTLWIIVYSLDNSFLPIDSFLLIVFVANTFRVFKNIL